MAAQTQVQSEYEYLSNLISLVREHKCLYDKKDPLYFNRLIKEKAWNDISIKVNKTSDQCKAKWKTLRERYGKEQKKQNPPSGSGASTTSDWAFTQEMSFLKDCLAPRRTRCNSDGNLEADLTETDFSQDVSTEDKHSTPTPAKKNKTSFDNLCEKFEDALQKFGQQLEPCTQNMEDGDELFLKTILSLLKDVPIQQKDSFKTEMFSKVMQLRQAVRTDYIHT